MRVGDGEESSSEASVNAAPSFAAAITLLRSVEWLYHAVIFTTRRGHAGPMEQTPEAQCLGHYAFDYALVPHQGTWESDKALVLQQAQAFNLPLSNRALVTDQHAGAVSPCSTLVSVDHPDSSSVAIKHSDKGIIVRLYNPLETALKATIQLGFPAQQPICQLAGRATKSPQNRIREPIRQRIYRWRRYCYALISPNCSISNRRAIWGPEPKSGRRNTLTGIGLPREEAYC